MKKTEHKMMTVRVVPINGNAKVTKEGTLGRYHTEADGTFEVPPTAYYHRALMRKEIELVDRNKKPKGDK